MDMLRVENIVLCYGERKIIKNLNLSAEAGDIISIIGPNASGKSTILKSIAGIIKPAAGKIYIEEKDSSCLGAKELAKKVAILLQQNTAPDEITVGELVYFGRYPYKRWFEGFEKKDLSVMEKVMHLTNTLHLKDKPLDKLSGGERQRAWIAMCLAQEPSIILFDEPTVYLDIAHQIEFFNLITNLNKETKTVIILVLHDLNQAARYGKYLIAVKDGVIFAEGSPKAVLTEQNIRTVYGINSSLINTDKELIVIPY